MKSLNVTCNSIISSSAFREFIRSENVWTTPSITSSSPSYFVAAKQSEEAASKSNRRLMLLSNSALIISTTVLVPLTLPLSPASSTYSSTPTNGLLTLFSELPNSGGVRALDLRPGDGLTPVDGDLVRLIYQ